MPFHPHQPARGHRPRPDTEHQPTTDNGAPRIGTPRMDTSSPAGPLLYTPAEAAQLLKIRESWLRKKAAARQVPCTFLGKHLRFSPTDLTAIIAAAAQPAGRRPRRRGAPTVRDRDLKSTPDRSVDPPQTNDHIRDGSSPWPG
jgi:excisionase family DNA binding protein